MECVGMWNSRLWCCPRDHRWRKLFWWLHWIKWAGWCVVVRCPACVVHYWDCIQAQLVLYEILLYFKTQHSDPLVHERYEVELNAVEMRRVFFFRYSYWFTNSALCSLSIKFNLYICRRKKSRKWVIDDLIIACRIWSFHFIEGKRTIAVDLFDDLWLLKFVFFVFYLRFHLLRYSRKLTQLLMPKSRSAHSMASHSQCSKHF